MVMEKDHQYRPIVERCPKCGGNHLFCTGGPDPPRRPDTYDEMVELELKPVEAEALANALDWLRDKYAPISDPTLMGIRRKLSKAIRGY